MPTVYEAADAHRAALLAGERAAASAMIRAYGAIWNAVDKRLRDLVARYYAAIEAGEDISPAWLLQRDRLTALQSQIEREISRFVRAADVAIVAQQQAAVQAALTHTAEVLTLQLEPVPRVAARVHRLPVGAVTDLAGTLADGSPLLDRLREYGPRAAEEARRVLLTGVGTGQGAEQIARRLRPVIAAPLNQTLTIVRTETLRSYRLAAQRSYEANADILAGWVWRSSLSVRTCAFCFAQSGRLFPLDVPFASHPNCRCSPVPRTKSWRDLGFPNVEDRRPPLDDGEARLRSLPVEDQRRVLGPGKWEAWDAGDIALRDLVGFGQHPQWGPVGFEVSLPTALRRAGRRAA